MPLQAVAQVREQAQAVVLAPGLMLEQATMAAAQAPKRKLLKPDKSEILK